MGTSERRKGKRVELYIVNLLRKAGLEGKRIPLSGATEFQKGDVLVYTTDGIPKILEVKAREKGFADIRARLIHKSVVRFVFGKYEFICYSWEHFIKILKREIRERSKIDEEIETARAYKQIANWMYDNSIVDYLVVKINRAEPFVIERRMKNDR